MEICIFDRSTLCGVEPDLDLEIFKTAGNVREYDIVPPEKVLATIGNAEAVICNKTEITAEILEKAPNLRYVGVMATGVNNIDLAAAKKRGVTVCNVPGYSTDAVAQLTFSFLLQFATNLHAYTASTARGDWQKAPAFTYFPYPMQEVCGKTLGIFGMGSIGKTVARIGAAFGMKILYTARSKKDLPYEFVSADRLFRESDFLTFHCPLTEETRGLICRDNLAKMKKSAFLINTARGGIVNEKDLAEALNSGVIAGFAADVLDKEPQRSDCPLIGAENCILTPHIAWAPFETRKRLLGVLFRNLVAFQNGTPQNAVV